MMDSVVDFSTYKDNKKNLIGIIGCGNRNFNDLFIQTAKKSAVFEDFFFYTNNHSLTKFKEIK
ncbi:class Ib ribonucleoside-diphosphate reductase assembly flavoprotein NrdI [Lactobacillus amylovorus]|uniref:class Ib ribonucleoside-diphosphate reductase assembly flavoprotein NrdI n=2 Tax=Lactobacillus amylovorus TaxID=1604 RepID=UPI003A5D1031